LPLLLPLLCLSCSDPETTEEEELVENLFDVLASCLLLEDNKAVFVEAEGEL